MITVGSLFSGIGGIDLGLERAGMRVIWQAETDPYASKVLAKHWPDVPNLGDVKQIDWSSVERPDLICGGFPCQPVSVAGQRRGQADDRWLWPEVARCLRHLGPRWALLENVPGLLVQPMGDVLGDLATLGYDTEWEGIPAAAVGAPHLRWRIFIVAHTVSDGLRQQPVAQLGRSGEAVARANGEAGGVADSEGEGLEGRWQGLPRLSRGTVAHTHDQRELQPAGRVSQERARSGNGGQVGDADEERRRGWARVFGSGGWRQPADPGWWTTEPDVGRVAHGIPNRVDRLRCLGNAVVPQVAEWVGRRILEADCHCLCHAVIQPGLVPCPSCDTGPDHSSR